MYPSSNDVENVGEHYFVTGYIIRVHVYPDDSDVGEHYLLLGTLSGYTCTRTIATFRTSGNTGYIVRVHVHPDNSDVQNV